MYTNLPHIYEGEIVAAVPQKGTDRNFQRYVVRVEMQDGSQILLPNVQESTQFGGIADYFQRRARASTDDGKDYELGSQENENARIGDRVYVAFIGGHIQKPVIIGHAQHPNQTIEFAEDDPEQLKPQAVFEYLGLRMVWGETGQFSIIHKGAPEIKNTAGGDLLGDLTGAAGALTGGGSAPTNPDLGTDDNPAVTWADKEGITLLEFLDEGVFRIRDAEGQMFELDRTKMRIYISNNDLKSTEDAADGPASGGNQISTNSTDAEYILLDKDKEMVLINARSIAQIYSADVRKDVTEGNHSHKIGGDSVWAVGGDESVTIDGSKSDEISGDWEAGITGNFVYEIKGDASFDVTGDTSWVVQGNYGVQATGTISQISSQTTFEIDGVKDSITAKVAFGDHWELSAANGFQVATPAAGGTSISMKSGQMDLFGAKGVTVLNESGALVMLDSSSATVSEPAGATLKLSGGKVALGSSAAELLDLCDQQLDAFINNASSIVLTSVGPGQLSPAVVTALTQIKTLLGSIKGTL